jgi:hypothetical protein
MKLSKIYFLLIAVVALGIPQSDADAQQAVNVTIENVAPADGFFFTPVFLGFHDGTFDVFDGGAMASPELELLAEGGVTSDLSNLLTGGQSSALARTVAGTSVGPPPFDPGESISTVFSLDATNNRYLNYASMVIPSNDAFFGNDNALELFDAAGNFNGTQTFDITAGMIYDGGTEVNDINGGAAFSALGGTSTTEALPIGLIDLADLNLFVGTDTVSGATIGSGLTADTVVARFTIAVPEPSSFAVMGLVGLVMAARRRRS